MVAHDYSKSVYDCPACKRLLQIKHDFSKSPRECPGCLEKAAIGGGYAAHAASTAGGASAHHSLPPITTHRSRRQPVPATHCMI
jgi:hypothetical protein